jgi:hypothetical protein
MNALPSQLSGLRNVHNFNASASLLDAELERPLQEKIRPQSLVRLDHDGHYQFSQSEPFHFEGILSYEGGYTQVAGYPSSKSASFVTLSTSVVEGLNVLDVVTADRVVAQISTTHPEYGKGQVPSVTFLGTRFENLRIAGHGVELDPHLDILGPKPDSDESYFENSSVLERVSTQYDQIATAKGLPDWASEEFPKGRPVLNGHEELRCSVIDRVRQSPGRAFGHVIDLPHFGKIYLGELKVRREKGDPAKGMNDAYTFQLTMIRLKMGCLAEGQAKIAAADSNGTGSSTGGHGKP